MSYWLSVEFAATSLYRRASNRKNEWGSSVGKNDAARIQPGDIAEALGLLTRLPVQTDGTRTAEAAWAWPLAGVLVGLLSAVIASVAMFLGLPPAIAAGLALATQIILTGALHEDGLADCADGFWGGADPDARLSIMKDSRIGAYGVIALILSLGLRWGALAVLFDASAVFGPMLAAAALSRVPMAALMHWLAPVRPGGLSADVGRPGQDAVILAAATGLLAALLVAGLGALLAAAIAAALCWGISRLALAKIGGQTGDVLGACQQIAEIGMLMVFVALVA